MSNLDHDWLREYPAALLQALAGTVSRFSATCHVTGGAVRDWLLGKLSQDLDVTVSGDGLAFAEQFAKILGGAFVVLDAREKVGRVVWAEYVVDCSSFREGTTRLEEDLRRRDFTMNALAIAFSPETAGLASPYTIMDPTGGEADLQSQSVRATSDEVFTKDPLRLLRAYRFRATLGFEIDPATTKAIGRDVRLVTSAAAERLRHEFDLLIAAPDAYRVIGEMAEVGMLWELFPELRSGLGLQQPPSHHLDVFAHSLETLHAMEQIQLHTERYFPAHSRDLHDYLGQGKRKTWLRWAALFHDLGKPAAHALLEDRITFYNHDQMGGRIFESIAKRFKFSREAKNRIARLVSLHMWPFHLSNVFRKKDVTARACLRLIKAMGEDLPGLFMLAMADSLAGQGSGKPAKVEELLARLHDKVDRVYRENIKPVLENPPLLTGRDLIDIFKLSPGPDFKIILSELQRVHVEGQVSSKEEATAWVAAFLKRYDQKFLV